MIYLFGFINKEKGTKLLKLKKDDGQEKWYPTDDNVYDYATKSIKKNEEVTIETKEVKGQSIITRITKASAPETPVKAPTTAPVASNTAEATTEPTCTDCGKKLKDNKYTKCFTCNQKNPTPKASGGFGKSPEVQDSIKRQAIMKAAADAVAQVFVGQVGDVDVLGDMIIKLYEKLLPKV
jgi:hypothetical protein